MLDIKFIRENKELIALAAKKKKIDFDVEKLLVSDDKRKEALQKVEEKRARQNAVSQEIPKADPTQKESLLAEMKTLKEGMQADEEALKEIMKEWQAQMLLVPNIPDVSVPDGDSDADNVEIRTWGEIPKFDFEPKHHIDLMLENDMVDLERGTKVAGFRGYFLKNGGARLEWAILSLAMDKMIKKGFSPMIVPSLVRKETLYGTGYLPQGEDDLYKTQDEDYLAGTGEVATMAYYEGETLKQEQLPIKIVAFSPCFRREAGSHGKDTRGIIRVHEFMKVEQLVLCEARHDESVKIHEEITKNAEEIMQALEIPYHVVVNCGSDIGLGQVKKYDIEAWVPSEKKYRETHSASYFHDFQTRRLSIRYTDAEGNRKLAHSLNSTAIAAPRIVASFVEIHQQKDGSIKIPKALQKYLGVEVLKNE